MCLHPRYQVVCCDWDCDSSGAVGTAERQGDSAGRRGRGAFFSGGVSPSVALSTSTFFACNFVTGSIGSWETGGLRVRVAATAVTGTGTIIPITFFCGCCLWGWRRCGFGFGLSWFLRFLLLNPTSFRYRLPLGLACNNCRG